MYTVEVLSNDEFDKLPYKHVKTSLGCADPKTNVAYVRDTGYNDITKQTIAHELDELMAKVSPHEEDGIRYKNLGQTFAGFGNTVKNVATAPFKAAGNALGSVFNSGAGQNAASTPGIAGGSPSNMNNPGGVFGKATDGFSIGNQSMQFPAAPKAYTPPSMPSAGGGGGSPFSIEAFQSALSPRTANNASSLTPQPAAPAAQPSAGSNLLSKVTDLFNPQTGDGGLVDTYAAPLAMNLIGNAFAPKVSMPDLSGISNDLRQQAMGGVNAPMNADAMTKLREVINADPEAPPEEVFANADKMIEEQLELDIKSLEQKFKAARPNANVQNDSAFRDALIDLQTEARDKRAMVRDEISFRSSSEQKSRQLQAIQTALNLDQAQMSQLVNIAQLDISQIMFETGLTAQEAQEFKQLFGSLGEAFIQGKQQQAQTNQQNSFLDRILGGNNAG